MNMSGRMIGHSGFVEIKEIPEVDLITSKGGKTIRILTEI